MQTNVIRLSVVPKQAGDGRLHELLNKHPDAVFIDAATIDDIISLQFLDIKDVENVIIDLRDAKADVVFRLALGLAGKVSEDRLQVHLVVWEGR